MKSMPKKHEALGICPKCRACEVVQHNGRYICEGSLHGECDFRIGPFGNGRNPTLAAIMGKNKKKITPGMMRTILAGFTTHLSGLVSKAGKSYELVITLSVDEDGVYEFEHGFPRRGFVGNYRR